MRFHWIVAVLMGLQASSVQPDREYREILHGVLERFFPKPTIRAGSGLDDSQRAVVEGLPAVDSAKAEPAPGVVVPSGTLVIDKITVSSRRAMVDATQGPMPAAFALTCGTRMRIALERAGAWKAADEEAWMTCAQPNPPGLPRNEDRLLEAVRLVFTYLDFESTVRIIAGEKVSPFARRVLSRVIAFADADKAADAEYSLRRDVFELHSVSMSGDLVTLVGTRGPIPRGATLACGWTSTISLRYRSPGWVFERLQSTVC